jgi:hypothetical protein
MLTGELRVQQYRTFAFRASGFVYCVGKGMLSAQQVAVGLLAFLGLLVAVPPLPKLAYSAWPTNACSDQVDANRDE